VAALGREDELVAVSDECDHPAAVRSLPRLSTTRIDPAAASRQVDAEVRAALARGEELYGIDRGVLQEVRPELILTQSLCAVCAVSAARAEESARLSGVGARVVDLEPTTLEEVLGTIDQVGRAIGAVEAAAALRARLEVRIAALGRVALGRPPVRVCVLEWVDPPFSAGHWVPDVVALAGGRELLGRSGARSREITWDDVAAARPDVVVVSPCGFGLERARREADLAGVAARVPGARVVCMDGSAYLSRPGPRLVDAAELLARELFPDQPAATSRATNRSRFGDVRSR
jgi:iron complex transport system substrate-binding protein